MTGNTEPGDKRGLQAYWMPYTANRAFKEQPRLVTAAKGHWYTAADGRAVYDSFSGLWTSGLGHSHPHIVSAVKNQLDRLDYAHAFQVGHPPAFDLARRLTALAPEGFDHAFFTNSGSESVDTALKISVAYHRLKGDAARTRFIGRERGYHGGNLGGTSVGGIPANRALFSGALLPHVSHLPSTHDPARNAFSRGQPPHGAELARGVGQIAAFHGAGTIAAVIVEPVAGSTGVLVPPVGYLEALRAECDACGALLIFDEVITGFGRVGAPFAAQRFGVTPDIICLAKGLTNGVIPMGAVLVKREIYEAFMAHADTPIELFHGYTYSGHPVATAAALATLDVYARDDVFARARALEPAFEAAIHGLKDHHLVADIRNFGLMGAVELHARPEAPGSRGFAAHAGCFERGLMVRFSGDTLQFAPFLEATPEQVAQTFTILAETLAALE
ncbi:MAG: aminotransferase class III-fold pyridoxal phosphate-dependent enzyme [Alphaproteobacteria bacterium]